jgi:GntR family transcriptional regulator/MocR family aminotransferase
MIFALDRESRIPLYHQIVAQVRKMIDRGTLKRGDRLPANRELAKTLGVNRSTVSTAYDELAAEGLIVSRVGSGSTRLTGISPMKRPGIGRKAEWRSGSGCRNRSIQTGS